MARPGALQAINDDEVLDRIRAGEHASNIAQSLGVHKSALSHRYKGKPEYVEARETGTEIRLNEVEDEIKRLSAPLPQPVLPDEPTDDDLLKYKTALKAWQMSQAEREFNLACARERFRAISWRAEREFPSRWGQRTHVTVENVGDLGERLRRARERVLPQDVEDAEVVHTQQASVIQSITDESTPK